MARYPALLWLLAFPGPVLAAIPGIDPHPLPARGPDPGLALPLAALDGPDALHLPVTIDVKMPDGSIVALDLEDYLKGVLPKEIGTSFPVEAMKAQAVAARSYAVWYAWSKGYICTTTTCQVWSEQHYAATDAAVEATRGQVLAWQGKVVPFFFSASCGGHTVSNAEVWSGEPLPWLTPAPCIENKTGACVVVCTPDQPKSSTCWGVFGHRVGLCQRGAQAMAACGSSHIEIVLHYAGGGTLIGPEGPVPLPDTGGAEDEAGTGVAEAADAVVALDAVEAGEEAVAEGSDVPAPDTAIPDAADTRTDPGAAFDPGLADAGEDAGAPPSSGSSCAAARSPVKGVTLSLCLCLILGVYRRRSVPYVRTERTMRNATGRPRSTVAAGGVVEYPGREGVAIP